MCAIQTAKREYICSVADKINAQYSIRCMYIDGVDSFQQHSVGLIFPWSIGHYKPGNP
jgi:hypothetical protein